MIRKIGRLILLIVGVIMLSVAIPVIIVKIGDLKAADWNNVEAITSNAALVWSVITLGVDAVFGIIALLGGIFGRKSLILALFAIVLIASPAYTLYLSIAGGTTIDVGTILLFVQQFTIPVFYFVGFLLV